MKSHVEGCVGLDIMPNRAWYCSVRPNPGCDDAPTMPGPHATDFFNVGS